jgi:hypothetical protein
MRARKSAKRDGIALLLAAAKSRAERAVDYERKHERRISAALAQAVMHGRMLRKSEAKEFAFHMTDWLYDLKELVALYRDPRRYSAAQAQQLLLGFLAHVPWHINAAHRILWGDPVVDPFELGAVRGSGTQTRAPGEPYSRQRRVGGRGRVLKGRG